MKGGGGGVKIYYARVIQWKGRASLLDSSKLFASSTRPLNPFSVAVIVVVAESHKRRELIQKERKTG